MQKMTIVNNVSFEIGSDLYVAGRTEDGADYTAEVYFITATNARGDRWRHASSFPGCNPVRDDEGYTHFADIRAEAQKEANTLMARMQARGAINLQHWREDRPVYGSSAYVAYGQADDLEQEFRDRMQGN
jgi:hypothetical protein